MDNITFSNPYLVEVLNLSIQKFNGTDRLSILPQYVEFNLYQSIFSPYLSALVVVDDQIGLFNNYPLVGEERVTITYNQKGSMTSNEEKTFTLEFIITDIKNISISTNNRSSSYHLHLASEEYFENARKKIAVCIFDTAAKAANTVFEDYIKKPMNERNSTVTEASRSVVQPKPFEIEDSEKIRKFVVSQQYPLDAIKWLTKHAIAPNGSNNYTYVFYEDFNGFHFKTIEKLIKEGKENYGQLYENRFIHASNIELLSPEQRESIQKNLSSRAISNIVFNRRVAGMEKVASGYIANEYMNINLLQKTYTLTRIEKDPTPDNNGLERYPLNTTAFLEATKKDLEVAEKVSRVKYGINNYMPGEEPEYEKKFGSSIKNMTGLNQIDIHITVPIDLTLNVGNVIWVDLGATHGFNQIETEKYVSGAFFIVEIKHLYSLNGMGSTTMRIFKDSYLNAIKDNMEYNQTGRVTETVITNPATGEATR